VAGDTKMNDRRFADTGGEPPDQDLKTRVAWLYHMEDMTQEAIAERLGLTRIRVVKLLAQCRRDGTVQIRVTGKLSECAALERDLESKFSIGEAIVIPTPDDASKISSLIGLRLLTHSCMTK
jgi:DNA-binding transcriptional regulator LsrR (DeoR family)